MGQRVTFWAIAVALLALLIWRLPVNGWGSLVWLVGTVSVHVLRTPHEQIARNTETERTYYGKSERVLVILVAFGMASRSNRLSVTFALIGLCKLKSEVLGT